MSWTQLGASRSQAAAAGLCLPAVGVAQHVYELQLINMLRQ